MATIYPSICPDSAPPGEKDFFKRLRDDPETENWIVLHSLDLVKHLKNVAGEADFVVIVPEYGILVVEVKSHTRINVDEQGWHLGNAHQPDRRGPFKQASEAMHSIRDYLIDREGTFAKMIAWSAVCFPRLEFQKKSSEWHDWQIIDRNRLARAPVSRTIREILSSGREILLENGVSAARHPEQHASLERCEAAAAALRPKFEIAISPKVKRREQDQRLLELTEQQYTALDHASLNNRVIFVGAAGTGKTVLAMEALRRRLAENPKEKCALFCFNKFLGEELSAKAKKSIPEATVIHIDSWLSKIARNRIKPEDRISKDYFEGRLALIALECLLENPEMPYFDYLILDEAQDLLRPYYTDILDFILKGGLAGGRWLMFGDFIGQDIFSQGQIDLDSFINERCPASSRFLLTTNCRNTQPIAEYVVTLGQLSPPYKNILRGDDRSDPELVFWKDRAQQKTEVVRFIKECKAAGYSPKDIVILSPRVQNSIGEELAADPEWEMRISPWGESIDRISYTTIQKFKGLEAPVILLTDFEGLSSQHQQALFYIGLSRALHGLGIFLHSDLKSFVRSIT